MHFVHYRKEAFFGSFLSTSLVVTAFTLKTVAVVLAFLTIDSITGVPRAEGSLFPLSPHGGAAAVVNFELIWTVGGRR